MFESSLRLDTIKINWYAINSDKIKIMLLVPFFSIQINMMYLGAAN